MKKNVNGVDVEMSAEEIEAFEASRVESPRVPQVVTMRQARLALLQAGHLASVDAALASLPNGQKEAALIEWEYSQEVHRNRPLVLMIGPALGLSEAQVDQLFILAATL